MKLQSPMNEKRIRKTIQLLFESLNEKWNHNLKITEITRRCPFCLHSSNYTFGCDCPQCYCPPSICANIATKGYIKTMADKRRRFDHYFGPFESDVERMRQLFFTEITKHKKMLGSTKRCHFHIYAGRDKDDDVTANLDVHFTFKNIVENYVFDREHVGVFRINKELMQQHSAEIDFILWLFPNFSVNINHKQDRAHHEGFITYKDDHVFVFAKKVTW